MEVEGRLSDVLNRRESIALSEMHWGPLDGSEEMTPAPGLERVDPFDLIAVFAGAGSLPSLTEAERAAHKLHKVPYDVALEVTPIHVIGTVYLFPGSAQRSGRGRGPRQPVLPARHRPGRPAGGGCGPGAARDPAARRRLTVRSVPIRGGGRRGTRG